MRRSRSIFTGAYTGVFNRVFNRVFYRVFTGILAIVLVLTMAVPLTGCKKSGFDVPDGLNREEEALFTAISKVCPKDDNHSKVEYLTFHIEGWSFSTIPEPILEYLQEYCQSGGARLVQLSFDELREQGLIEKGDGGFFSEEEDTYALGKGKIFTFTKAGDENSDELTVKLTGYISDNDQNGYDIILNYKNGAWQFVKFANTWGQAYMNTPDPGETTDVPQK